MRCRHGVLLAVWFGMGAVGRAQSFDCERSTTVVEKAVCADPSLRLADGRLAAAYRQVMRDLPPDVKAVVRADEANWVDSNGNRCADKPAFHENFATCLKRRYQERTAELQKMLSSKGGVTFVTLHTMLTGKDSADDTGNKDVEETPGFGTLHASWPQSLSEAPEWKIWNAAVLAETQKMAGGDGEVNGPWRKEWAAGAETEVSATVDVVTPEMVSVGIADDGMGHGAAHPNEANEEFHWMLKKQRRLRASDVFLEGTGWESALGQRCRAALKMQLGKDYESYVGKDFQKVLDEVALNPANWTMDAKALTISFPEYSVTPRAEPAEPVTVTWTALKRMLVAGFEPPL